MKFGVGVLFLVTAVTLVVENRGQAFGPLKCLSCVYDIGNLDNACLGGQIPQIDCPSSSKSCAITISYVDDKDPKIQRSCKDDLKSDCTGWIGTPLSSRTCYCQGNGCNNKDYLYPENNHQPLECLQCSHYEDGSQTNIGCKEGNEKGRPCLNSKEDASCYYEVEKRANGELKSIRRGCSGTNPFERTSVTNKDRECDPVVANGKTKCYCYRNNCNTNTQKGLLCARCAAVVPYGCSTGVLEESEVTTCSSSGASLNSCHEEKVFNNRTGKISYYRGCAAVYWSDRCDAPQVIYSITNTGTTADKISTECFCNTDRCIPNKEPVPTEKTTIKSTANSGSEVQLIISASITLGYLFYLSNGQLKF